MCIWKVAEKDRHCEYCTYYGGCEKHMGVDREISEIIFQRYRGIMNGIIGRDVLEHSRDRTVVWGRYIIIYRLYDDGIKPRIIADMLGLDRTTVIYARKQVENLRKYPLLYKKENDIFLKFYNNSD